MNEIDGIAQPGNLTDPPTEATVALPLDAAHQREDCICHDGHVHPTEAPTNFQIGDHRHASQPILKYRHREEIASHQHQPSIAYGQGTVSFDVISQDKIAGKTREVMEHRSRIPKTFAQHLGKPQMDVRQTSGECPHTQIALQLAFGALFQPRRKHRHQHVQAKEHIDEPHVSDFHPEVHEDVYHIPYKVHQRISPRHHVINRINHAPHHKRNQDSSKSTFEETCHIHLQRQEKITRNHHK